MASAVEREQWTAGVEPLGAAQPVLNGRLVQAVLQQACCEVCRIHADMRMMCHGSMLLMLSVPMPPATQWRYCAGGFRCLWAMVRDRIGDRPGAGMPQAPTPSLGTESTPIGRGYLGYQWLPGCLGQ